MALINGKTVMLFLFQLINIFFEHRSFIFKTFLQKTLIFSCVVFSSTQSYLKKKRKYRPSIGRRYLKLTFR